MRVLIIPSEFPPGPGGIGTHAFELAIGLYRLGWDVCVATTQDYVEDLEIKKFNRALPYKIVRLFHHSNPIWEAISRTRNLLKLIRQWQPDLLIVSGGRVVWLVAMITFLHPIPWIAIGHGTEFGSPATWEGRLTRWAFNRAAGVVHVSNYTQQAARASGIQGQYETVIPNGANAERFIPNAQSSGVDFRKRYKLEGTLILLTVGNVSRRKGQDVVIQAMPSILRKFPNVHYVMIGLPTLQNELEQLAAQLGISSQIHFVGRVDPDTLLAGYQACDIFIMNSRHAGGDFEGYGIAVVEAALCGKPAVVSKNSGLVEAIQDGITGLAVAEENPDATANAIVKLLGDTALRMNMGEKARLRALSEQTWPKRVSMYDRYLREIAKS